MSLQIDPFIGLIKKIFKHILFYMYIFKKFIKIFKGNENFHKPFRVYDNSI